MKRLRVRISSQAAEQLAPLNRRRQGMLKREIERVAGSAPGSRFIRVGTPMDVAAAEVLDDAGVLLVYAVMSRQELVRRIWGLELDRRLQSRQIARLAHGRGARG